MTHSLIDCAAEADDDDVVVVCLMVESYIRFHFSIDISTYWISVLRLAVESASDPLV